MGNIKVDIRDLKRLQANMKKLNESQSSIFMEKLSKELAARLLAKVKKRTPVGQYPPSSGKKGGTLRREWTIGEVKKVDNIYQVEVMNPMEYASYVEYGHRTRNGQGWVEGRFMLTISEQELESDAPKVIGRQLKNILGESFK